MDTKTCDKDTIWFGKDKIYNKNAPINPPPGVDAPIIVEVREICYCKWIRGYYYITIGNRNLYWKTDRDYEFEEQFPEFPYYTNPQYTNWCAVQNRVTIKKLEQKVNDIEKHMAIIVSQFETLMTVLGARLPTDDTLELLCLKNNSSN